MPLTENDVAMPRSKRRSIALSALYRLMRLTRAAGLERLAMRAALFAAWALWRLAYEICALRIGPAFYDGARAVSAEDLRRHVPANAVVLDFGCGGGRLTRLAAPFCARVVGVDAQAGNIETARSAGVPANAEYVCGDGLTVLAAREYDVALFVHVFEHVDDVDALLRVARAHAKRIIVEVPNLEADPLNAVRVAEGLPFYSDADHVREYTPAILRQQLQRNGWRMIEQEVRGAVIVAVAEGS